MSAFARRLRELQPDPARRRWVYLPYDQLNDRLGPLAHEDPGDLGLVLVESTAKARRRPYHKGKLATVLTNQRHFALEQAERGVAIRYESTAAHYHDALRPLAAELGPLRVMEPAEHELRAELRPLVEDGLLQIVEHEGWLTTAEQFRASQDGPPWRMDAFYRHVRRETGVLMNGGKPVGGKYSFDAENRKAWSGDPPAPAPPTFAVDEITAEVGRLIEDRFAAHPGELRLERIAASAEDAARLWHWAKSTCMRHFGPYQDAMSAGSAGLFHTRISTLLNLHRLLPAQVVEDALRLRAPLASIEAFIRQVLGWREFVRHVHRETQGLRRVPGRGTTDVAPRPGDGGIGRWRGRAWDSGDGTADGGARPTALHASRPLPVAYWGAKSGLHCLDHVVEEVWTTGYGHHITRLMVLANIGTLLDVSPRELTDWFWVAYTDAYDWVVEPNVLGMGTFAVGDLLTTKPYVAGANYINRMSDLCDACRFDPSQNCPVTHLYWAFLDRHRGGLASNPRLRLPYASLARRSEARRAHDATVFAWVRDTFARGDRLDPDALPERAD